MSIAATPTSSHHGYWLPWSSFTYINIFVFLLKSSSSVYIIFVDYIWTYKKIHIEPFKWGSRQYNYLNREGKKKCSKFIPFIQDWFTIVIAKSVYKEFIFIATFFFMYVIFIHLQTRRDLDILNEKLVFFHLQWIHFHHTSSSPPQEKLSSFLYDV